VAPLGLPVVPLVYWMSATSAVVGPATEGLMPVSARRSSHGVVPEISIVSSPRCLRAAGIGSRRRSRRRGYYRRYEEHFDLRVQRPIVVSRVVNRGADLVVQHSLR